MTFLNPLYLIALAAAAIPIILHLLNLRRTRVIDFSTLAFLRELQKSKIRRLKIRQWFLLALRTLIIICIVLAFARPAFRGTFAGLAGSRARSSVVIILDDSFSMLASDEGGQLLKQAKARAAGILDLLQPGDEVAFVRGSDPASAQPQFTAALNAIRAEIERVQPSFAHHTLHDALTAAHVLLDRSQNFNKEVYVVTDEQRSHFIRAGQEATLRLFNDQVRVFLFPLGTQRAQNTAVVSVAVRNSLFEKNKPVTVSAAILNFGTRPLRSEVASLYLAGERVAQKSVDIDPGGRKEVEFSAVPKSVGFIEGFVQIEDDILPEDNRRYFAFHVPEKISALLIAERPAEALFLTTALRTALSSGPDQVLDVTTIPAAQIGAVNLKKYDVLFLLAGKSLDAAAARRVADAVREGIGAYILPSGDADALAGMNALFAELQLPAAQGMNGAPGNTASYTQFGKIDFAHPLFTGMFLESDTKKPPQVESPRIYAAVRLPVSERLQTVIATSAGLPFLMEGSFGAGRLVVSAVAPLLTWSDFPLRGLFVPLLNRSAYYLASRDMNALAHLVGETFDVTLPAPPEGTAAYTISSPSRAETKINPRALASGLSFQIANDLEPGLYTIKGNGRTLRVIPVNIDPAESDLTRITPEERMAFWSAAGISHPRVLGRDADARREVMQSRFGLELWKYLLGAAILFALLEMMIARDVKRAPIEPAAA